MCNRCKTEKDCPKEKILAFTRGRIYERTFDERRSTGLLNDKPQSESGEYYCDEPRCLRVCDKGHVPSTNKEHCPKCWHIPQGDDHKNSIYNGYCFNPDCICHSAPTINGWEEEHYRLTERLLNHFKNGRISYTQFIDPLKDFVVALLATEREKGIKIGETKWGDAKAHWQEECKQEGRTETTSRIVQMIEGTKKDRPVKYDFDSLATFDIALIQWEYHNTTITDIINQIKREDI